MNTILRKALVGVVSLVLVALLMPGEAQAWPWRRARCCRPVNSCCFSNGHYGNYGGGVYGGGYAQSYYGQGYYSNGNSCCGSSAYQGTYYSNGPTQYFGASQYQSGTMTNYQNWSGNQARDQQPGYPSGDPNQINNLNRQGDPNRLNDPNRFNSDTTVTPPTSPPTNAIDNSNR